MNNSDISEKVEVMALMDIPVERIAAALHLTLDDLKNNFSDELTAGADRKTMSLAQALFRAAVGDGEKDPKVSAIIFAMRALCGKEPLSMPTKKDQELSDAMGARAGYTDPALAQANEWRKKAML